MSSEESLANLWGDLEVCSRTRILWVCASRSLDLRSRRSLRSLISLESLAVCCWWMDLMMVICWVAERSWRSFHSS